MNDQFESFISSLESVNTARVVNSLKSLFEQDFTDYTVEDLEKNILDTKPNSPKAIITACYVLGLYARYIQDEQLYQKVQDLDRNALWKKAKPNAAKKFISHSCFEDVYHDIGMCEELNSFYYQTLFRCIYEGIYSDDVSVLKNLKASDIHGNVVTLFEDDGKSYDLEISAGLAEDLREMGTIITWERKNRFGVCKINITGLYPDSCFKTEIRKDASETSYRFSYYRCLRKIAKEYLEYNLLPLQLYVSGIMYRISLKLKENNISVLEAFSEHNRNRLVHIIINDELTRCNCNTDVRNFRQIVKGHLEVFEIEE